MPLAASSVNTMTALLSNALTRELVVFSSLAGMVVLSVIVLFVLRTFSLPYCWKCGFTSVRRSQSHHPLDVVARLVFLYPYRCGKCQKRFYCFGAHRLPPHNVVRTMAAGKG